jgi:hypothetical protein
VTIHTGTGDDKRSHLYWDLTIYVSDNESDAARLYDRRTCARNRGVGHVQWETRAIPGRTGTRLEPSRSPKRRSCMPGELAFLGVGPGAGTTIGTEDGSRHSRKRRAS